MDDGRMGSKLKMEEALEKGNLEEALSHLDALIDANSCLALSALLANSRVKDLPTLHYLARVPFQEDDIPRLDKLIRIFIESGYDINKTTDRYLSSKGASPGFTAFLASVEQRNGILMEYLLQHGARPDVRDKHGFSACHWAVLGGDLKCLEKLVEIGGNSVLKSTAIEKRGEYDLHPLLHTAVDEGHTEIVLYLLNKEGVGVDVNEKAIYKTGMFSPFGRALCRNDTAIIQVLVKHGGTNPSRFGMLQASLESGDTRKAFSLLKYFPDEELSNHKIGRQCALHCINPLAFSDERRLEFTKKLILEYVRRGWDVNTLSKADKRHSSGVSFLDGSSGGCSFNQVTLLHLACLQKFKEIIKVLVEEAGADVNCKTQEGGEMTPLQILLALKDWQGASYLIEKGADLNVRGSLGRWSIFTQFSRINLTTGNLELDSTFNSVELLVRMGCEEDLPFLEQVLAKSDVVLHGANEFHLAMETLNPMYILKVLQRCAKIISKEELNWITVNDLDRRRQPGGIPKKIVSLIWLFDKLHEKRYQFRDLNVEGLADLIKLFLELGYNQNPTWRKPTPREEFVEGPLMHYILRFDFEMGDSNRLLRTMLQCDYLKVDWKFNHVASLIVVWNKICVPGSFSSDLKTPLILDAIKLLVTHGLDVSDLVVRRTYHLGSNVILKMLYRAGATISNEFFTTSAPVCPRCSGETLSKEKAKLKEWKDNFDRDARFTLKRICGLRIRKMLKTIGDLKMLEGLPKSCREAVLGSADL